MSLPTDHYYNLSTQPITITPPRPNVQARLATTSAEPPTMQQSGVSAGNQNAFSFPTTDTPMPHTRPNLSYSTNSSSSTSNQSIFSSSSSSSSSVINSSVINSSVIASSGDTLLVLLALPENNLSAEEIRAQKLLRALHDFVSSPAKTRSDFLAICVLLKESTKTENSYKLWCEYKSDWLSELANKTVAFLTVANLQAEETLDWTELSMNDVAIICYALKASVEPNRKFNFFSKDQLMALTPVLRGITRKLIDHLDDKQLMCPSHQSYGDVLSVLSWMVNGLQLNVPTQSGEEIKLLGGAKKGKVGIDAIFKQALVYFLAAKLKALDTRQLGKLVHSLGKVLNLKMLNLEEAGENQQTLKQSLSEAVVDLCSGYALLKFSIWGQDNFGVPELKLKPVDPVVVANIAVGLLAFLSHLFIKTDKRVGLIVNNMTDLILKVLEFGNPLSSDLKMYESFLIKAHKENFEGTNRDKIKHTIDMIKNLE